MQDNTQTEKQLQDLRGEWVFVKVRTASICYKGTLSRNETTKKWFIWDNMDDNRRAQSEDFYVRDIEAIIDNVIILKKAQ